MSKDGEGITEKLRAQCNADDQFSRFDSLFRKVISVPKEEILKTEAEEKVRKAHSKKRRA